MNKEKFSAEVNVKKALAPFSCQYTPQIPELLLKLNFLAERGLLNFDRIAETTGESK